MTQQQEIIHAEVVQGGVTTGGVYAFDIGSSDIILGVQPTGGDFTPGSIRLAMTNNTGSTVRTLNIAYTIAYDNNQEKANSLNFSYSPDNTNYYSLNSLDFTTPEASDASGWQTTTRSISITGLEITNTSNYYLSWDGNEVSGSGSMDEYGIDDIVVSMSSSNLDILISEIMYDPNSADASWEWIEIYNNSSSSIDLSNFVFDDDDFTARTTANIASGFLAAGTGIIIFDGLSITSANFLDAWAGSGSVSLGSITDSWPELTNSGDRIGIWTNLSRYNSRDFNNDLDEVSYEDATNSWPNVAGSQSISYNDGTFAADNNLASSWSLSTVSGSTAVGTGYTSSVNGTTNSGADIGSPYGNISQPVVLIEFKAIKQKNMIKLSWKTASEISNDRFEIEKSGNGSYFEKIGEAMGRGDSEIVVSYNFEDNYPFDGDNYYRLKQIDFDGKFEYSNVEMVKFNDVQQSINIYPNPTSNTSDIEFTKTLKGSTTVQLIDPSGRIIRNIFLYGEHNKMTITTKNLLQGIYILKITNGFDLYLEKIIKK